MKTQKINVITMQEQEVPLCPYCGGTPIVEVEIRSNTFESDTIAHEEVNCHCCGLGAPRKIWNAICEAIEEPIAGD